MNFKQTFKWLFTALAAFVLVACGAGEGTEGGAASSETSEVPATSNDTLVIGLSNNVDSLNPFHRTGAQSTYAQRFFYESILNFTKANEFEPRLGNIETEDNQNFTITINEDANWTDGTPVSADDLVYSINTTAHPDTLTSQATYITVIEGTTDDGKLPEGTTEVSGVQKVDDKTVTITTKEPVDLNYFSEFFGYSFLMAPKHVFEDLAPADIHTSEEATNPTVTNGAYKFVKFQDNDFLELAANEDYYRGAPKISSVFFKIVDGTAMTTDLQAGNIHMIAGGGIGIVTHDDAALLEDVEHLDIEGFPSAGVQYLIPNAEGRFSNPVARRALAYALNRELAVENLLNGNGEVTAGPYTSVSGYRNEEIEPRPYDVEQAQALFAEAGFDMEEPVVLMIPTGNSVREQMGDLIHQDLLAAGLNVVQEKYDFSTWITNAREGKFDLGLVGMSHTYDPDLSSYFSSGGATNMGFYKSEKMDELLTKGKNEVDFESRKPIYDELQEFFMEDQPVVPLYSEFDYKIQSKNLNGGVSEFWPNTTSNIHEWTFEN